MNDMKAAQPSKRASKTDRRYSVLLALELPDIIHYIYTFSYSCPCQVHQLRLDWENAEMFRIF